MTEYYNYILGPIPLVLLGITGMLTVIGLQLTTAVSMVAGVAALLTGHAFFVNGPSSLSPSRLNEHAGPNAADVPPLSVFNAD